MVTEHHIPESVLPTVADPELERMLQEAYAGPGIPPSLLQRLDAGIAAEWSRAPGLIVRRSDSFQIGIRKFVRSLRGRVAAGVVAAVLISIVVLSPGGSSSAWAAMLAAIAREGVVEMRTPEGTRWLSLSEGLLGEEDRQETRLLDARQRVLWTRRKGAPQVLRRKLTGTESLVSDDSLVVAFLLGLDRLSQPPSALSGWELAGEKADRSRLILQFANAGQPPVEVSLQVDPDSRLPVQCVVASGPEFALSYGRQPAAERRERDFPVSLSIVETAPESDVMVGVDHRPSAAAGRQEAAASLEAQEQPAIAGDPPVGVAVVSPMEGEPARWRPVAATRRTSQDVVAEIDRLVAHLWEREGVSPAPPADDAELLRRVYLDLSGRTPTVPEVRSWLKERDGGRYERLVDRLLSGPDHASHLATVWRTYLIPDGVDLTAFGGVEAFDKWLADQFTRETSYDEIVRSLLLAEGRLSQSGPLLFYSAAKLDPDQLAARTARVFLGVRLECAQCHDHPFEPWKQDDFWSLAAFFSRISRPRGQLATASRVMRVHDIDSGDVMLPDSRTVVPPRFLNASLPVEETDATARRRELADWVTSPSNPYFARATANRVWGHLFGRGIVDPVDDFGVRNAPASPELLEVLAGQLIANEFRLRPLFRSIVLSQAYRLSSGADEVDGRRAECFAQMNVKMLTADQIYDCITVATLLQSSSAANQEPFNVARFGNSARAAFLQQFRTPASARTTDYQGGIPQALTLMNGPLIQGATGLSSSGLLRSLEAPFFSNEQRIEIVYLATLSRTPRPDERRLMREYLPETATGAELKEQLADLLWALLNSAEFTMNH